MKFKQIVFAKHLAFAFLLAIITVLSSSGFSAAESIKARAAVVIDASTGKVLYAKNPDLVLMPASTTKLVTALVVMEYTDLDRIVTISRKAASTPPTRVGFKAGDRVSVRTLLRALLMKSANDAAVALAEAVAGSEEEFVSLMNRKAAELGALDTKFINPNGLPGEGQQITAHDLTTIMKEVLRHPELKEIISTREAEVTSLSGQARLIRNTNKLLWEDREILGGKTGYTREAMHCFVFAGERENQMLIGAVLGAPSRPLLWKGSEDLLSIGSRVMRNETDPDVHLASIEDSPAKVVKASYGKKTRAKARKVKKTRKANRTKRVRV